MRRVFLRGASWLVREQTSLGSRVRLSLEDPESGEHIEALCPPDEYEPIVEPAPSLDRRSLVPFGIWASLHQAVTVQAPPEGGYAAFVAGRISPEAYQFAPLARLLVGPRRSILIADDVGLGKTIEAGICMLELIARGIGKRILIVVPPGLIPQWIDEMHDKFGLSFVPVENSASLDRAQTAISEGLQPWAYFDRVITSTEYLKRREVSGAALARMWDVIVVDEAHYLAESGTAANPYSTARTRLGPRLREASRALILLTATPHNGYRHSFRSLLELVEPANATLHGRTEDVQRRVAHSMIRRLKPQIVKTGASGAAVAAFPVRLPVSRIEVRDLCTEEKDAFRLVTDYCARTIKAATLTQEADLVSFAMQIVKKRMLSSRKALHRTVENRLKALASSRSEEPPARSELRELQAALPLAETAAERTADKILRAAISRDVRRRKSEKQQLEKVRTLLEAVAEKPDPKIAALVADLERDVLSIAGEKAIIFTEYRDTLEALREAFGQRDVLRGAFAELTGGLSARQRKARIARFHEADCRILIATDAASEGLNFQKRCCRLYHFELPWNPNRLEQRNGRIDRHGQTRAPDIRYLFYPDSPEDRVLDRLVQRIGTMHDDRVSTPDILGILEGARLEEILGGIESEADGEAKAASLLRVFDTRQEEFAYQLAPLLIGGGEDTSIHPYANAVSADPIVADDAELERLMLDTLRPGLRPGALPETWRIDVPRHLQGPGVSPRYEWATFRRSIAARIDAREIEFIHRLHPLSRAIGAQAMSELTLEPARNQFAARLAVRQHSSAGKWPYALFTFLERQSHPAGRVMAVGIEAAGRILDHKTTDHVLADAATAPGEVSWDACQRAFEVPFAALQARAALAAAQRLSSQREKLAHERRQFSSVLREEANLYKADRLAEIDEEERAARAGSREQMELFRETAINWLARRAAVETNLARRLAQIEEFAALPEAAQPQPLGVLLVFPPS